MTAAVGLDRYRLLLARPHAVALICWSLLGRLPLGMVPIAILLLLRGEGVSYGQAGIVVAAYAVALGVGAPIGGRQVDRHGPTVVLRVRGLVYPALLGLVAVLAVGEVPLWAVAGAASLAGVAHPPVSSTVRVVWPRLAPGELRSTAYAFEAAVQEVFFVCGPLIAAVLASVVAWGGLAGAALASLVGSLVMSGLPPVRETPPSRHGGAGPLGALVSPGVRTVIVYAGLLGIAFGLVELGFTAFADDEGARALGGVALACFSGGSLVGGLVAGLRPIHSELRRFLLGGVALIGVMLALLLATSIPTLCVLAFVAGLPIAPTIAAIYVLIDHAAARGTVAEAFAWFGTAISLGVALGMALSGVLVDARGTSWVFATGALAVVVAVGFAWARRGTLADVRSPQVGAVGQAD